MQPNLVGQKLGKYTIREMLGMGGMGAVYRAYQEDLKREVALKVIAPNFAAQEELVARFIREAQTAASLEHAHIVPIYDYGVINGQLYIVMRLLTGGTLSQRIDAARKSGTLPTSGECAALLDQLAGALDYAHERGVIHRDIKPGNIMFDNHGDAFLVDFGIAKAGDSTNLTRGSSVIGSPHYMAPEQWRGDPATAATDQYALAVVLFTMLTGKLPFEAETPYAVMQLHINTPPPSPTLLRADLSPGLGLVMERAMAKDGAARFPSMRAFADAFRQSVGERMVGETGFFTRPLETTRTVVVPGGSGSQPVAAAATAGAPSGSTSQSLSQTIRQQRVGLAVGLGAGLIIAVAAGVLLLMQNRGAADLNTTATAVQATLIGMANLTATAGSAALIASPTTEGGIAPASSATPVPPTETLAPTWTPSPTATPPPSATLTPSLAAEQIAASATAAREAEIAVTATERAALTGTARASATAAAQATQAVETAAAQALETLIARNTATSAAIAANAAATLQAEQQATEAALSVAATLDAIVQNTRAANNAAASATAAAQQATRDAQATGTAAAHAAQTATQAALDARATRTAEALSAAQTATQAALDARATRDAVDQAATQSALDARATETADARAAALTATQAALDERAAALTATQAALDQRATRAAADQTATQAAQDAQRTRDALTAAAQRLATDSAATATRSAELLAAQETLSALQTEAANLTATAVAGPLTATAGGVSGTMAALNARATALRATATARAVAVTSPTATVPSRVLASPTPAPLILASPTLLPSPTQQPQVGRPGIFSPGDLMERRVLTTQADGFVRTVPLCCAASDLFVEIAFEMPNTTDYWDIGVAVREQEAPNQELRFYITSSRTWSYDLGAETQASGSHSAPFNTRAGTINRLTLVAFDRTGIALLNGEIVAVLDFSAILNSGDIYIGTEFAAGSPPGIDIAVVSANVGVLDPAFGPSDGSLAHRASNGGVESVAADGVRRGSFIARAVLDVPYTTAQNGWDIGFDFRKPGANRFVRLIVDAQRQTWYLYNFNGEFTLNQSGSAAVLRQGANDVNELILVAVREHGYLILNGQPVGRFELPMIPGGGAIELGTGFFSGNEVDGQQTPYSEYTVWTFADQP